MQHLNPEGLSALPELSRGIVTSMSTVVVFTTPRTFSLENSKDSSWQKRLLLWSVLYHIFFLKLVSRQYRTFSMLFSRTYTLLYVLLNRMWKKREKNRKMIQKELRNWGFQKIQKTNKSPFIIFPPFSFCTNCKTTSIYPQSNPPKVNKLTPQ